MSGRSLALGGFSLSLGAELDQDLCSPPVVEPRIHAPHPWGIQKLRGTLNKIQLS